MEKPNKVSLKSKVVDSLKTLVLFALVVGIVAAPMVIVNILK